MLRIAVATLALSASRETLVVALIALLLLYLGVVLPAVWSTRPARRRAAGQVLQMIISGITRRSRTP